MPKRVLFVFGTRPEVIKMAPVIKLARKTSSIDPVVCVTAQHRHLLDQALGEFGITPDIDLDLMKPRQTLYDVTSKVILKMKDVYRKIKPDVVIVQGDTTTVFAASLACYYENIDIGHLEAGLRSGDNKNPFPEEVNRRFVSLVAKYNFCPTETSKNNLLKEGVDPKRIFVTGNTVVDAVEMIRKSIRKNPPAFEGMAGDFFDTPFVLITGHRRENFNGGMRNIALAVKALAAKYPKINWLWAVHMNPNARDIVFKTLHRVKNVKLIEPPPYREFAYLMDNCKFIISDSGGVQEEGPSFGKKVLVTRITTERPEGIQCGTSILVGTDAKRIIKESIRLADKKKPLLKTKNPFGDGKAAKRIIDIIIKSRSGQYKQVK